MLKKTIMYEDLDGNTVTEDFWFHLNKAEIAKMELSTEGGFAQSLNRIIGTKNGAVIIEVFEDIIAKSYGIRGEDSKRFMKSPEISQAFMQTEAYSVLFMELVTDADASSAFVNGIIPVDLVDKPDLDKPIGPKLVPNIEAAKTIQDVALSQVEALSPAVREMTLEEMQAAIAKAQPAQPVPPVTQ